MHDESLEPRAYAKLHADRYLWQEQQERAAVLANQQRLKDAAGREFYGRAQTATGYVWWYDEDGKRIPLLPVEPQTAPKTGEVNG